MDNTCEQMSVLFRHDIDRELMEHARNAWGAAWVGVCEGTEEEIGSTAVMWEVHDIMDELGSDSQCTHVTQ
jgi:hypothetical protein